MSDIINMESAVRGCWLGKNIGGTLGAPFEGQRTLQNVSFYVQENLNGNPEPNDDLDLQLIWLTLVEFYGIYNVTPRLLGEYWVNSIIGPWNEYAVCRWNCRSGFYPPLSGAMDNEVWQWSNGAWIRSEIWACLFPGNPDRAIEFAYRDSCCDHCGEGIYAEMFTAALESAAFVEKDLRKLIDIGLSKIPVDSMLRKSIELVCRCYDSGVDWISARNQVVEFNAHLGWFQAPANVSFVVIGLLYGEGDFSKTICTATNCGDDTDCTAATAGAIMGIIYGAENIPEQWIKPIGDLILTKAIDKFNLPQNPPATITELVRRVLILQKRIAENYPVPAVEDLASSAAAEKIWARSPYELTFDISYMTVGVEYINGPLIEPGQYCPIRLHAHSVRGSMPEVRFRWLLPENWSSSRVEVRAAGQRFCDSVIETDLTLPEHLESSVVYVQLEVTTDDRAFPTIISVPFRRKGSVNYPRFTAEDSVEVYNMIARSGK